MLMLKVNENKNKIKRGNSLNNRVLLTQVESFPSLPTTTWSRYVVVACLLKLIACYSITIFWCKLYNKLKRVINNKKGIYCKNTKKDDHTFT